MVPALTDTPVVLSDPELADLPDRLDDKEVASLVQQMYQLHLGELSKWDRIYEYTKGKRGVPEVPEGSGDEVKEIAALAVKNVLGMVRDSFAQSLSVVGYRDAMAQADDPAWEDWQRNRMDARQGEVYRPSIQYGVSYVTVLPDKKGRPRWRTRSPRQILAVYDDPVTDEWPQYGLETWVTNKGAKKQRRGTFIDDRYEYDLDLGEEPVNGTENASATKPITVRKITAIREHGATDRGEPVCPIIRFVNTRDADDMVVGEIEPLIGLQKAINCVNFDRLLVSRFGANPQRVISGWTGSKNEVLKASALRVWTFEDPEVKAQAFPAASVEPYNAVLEEMLAHVAMVAQISPTAVTGKIANVSAEALAATEHNQQLKLTNKRESFGESWEQVFRVSGAMSRKVAQQPAEGDVAEGESADGTAAEVVWRDTEARTFATIVDGIVKLAQAGVPIEFLLPLVPSLTQQQIQGIKSAMRSAAAKQMLDKLLAAPTPTPPDAPPIDDVLDGQQKQGTQATQAGGGNDAGGTAVSGSP